MAKKNRVLTEKKEPVESADAVSFRPNVFSLGITLFVFALFLAFLFLVTVEHNAGVSNRLSGVPIVNWFFPLPSWFSSPMFFLLPLLAFGIAFVLVDWINRFFSTRAAFEWWFMLLIVLLGLLAFAWNLSYYFGEVATLNSNENLKVRLAWCFDTPTHCNDQFAKLNSDSKLSSETIGGRTVQVRFLPLDYFHYLRQSAFLLFLAGLSFGWLARLSAAFVGEKTGA